MKFYITKLSLTFFSTIYILPGLRNVSRYFTDDRRQMAINLDTRIAVSSVASEIYISATPTAGAPVGQQFQQIFTAIRDEIKSKNAHILHERVFGTQDAINIAADIRSKAYGDIDDGVAPTFLISTAGGPGPVAGVHVHAVVTDSKPELINLDGKLCGRILRLPDRTCLTLSDISAEQSSSATEQAKEMLEKAESALAMAGTDMFSVVRTWMWLKDILAWYDDFNLVRNNFFTERGLITRQMRQSMPASTGIGLAPAKGQSCSMDLVAVPAPANSIEYLQTTGKQHCAFEYGSAFSRATKANTPAGKTVYISGTASIDTSGATTSIADAAGQINTTIENVQAVLKDMNCRDEDVVQVLAYCKTTEVEKIFNDTFKDKLGWPWVTAVCDICRHDLLFEIEAAAIPHKRI